MKKQVYKCVGIAFITLNGFSVISGPHIFDPDLMVREPTIPYDAFGNPTPLVEERVIIQNPEPNHHHRHRHHKKNETKR